MSRSLEHVSALMKHRTEPASHARPRLWCGGTHAVHDDGFGLRVFASGKP